MSRLHTLLLALLLAGPTFAAEEPFSALDFDAATAKAKADGKLLLVDFTATWCPPCKMMEKQTWPDEKVQAWVREHAVAIQVDIDKLKDLAQKFGIQAIPTVVFLKDGEELDRYTGFRGPEEFVTWGDGVASGTVSAATRTAESDADAASEDPDRRYAAGKDLAARGQLDAALEQFMWVWKATRDVPKWIGVRHSFLLNDMAQLAERHPPAKVAMDGLLEEAQQRIETAPSITQVDWREWASLCRTLGQAQRLAAWYDAHRAEDGTLQVASMNEQVLERARDGIFDELVAEHRYVDAAHVGGDLLQRAQRRVEKLASVRAGLKARGDDEALKMYDEMALPDIAALYGCSQAVGRPEQAHEIAGVVLRAVDSGVARLELVRAALTMSDSRDPQLGTLLREAEGLGAKDDAVRAQWEQRAGAGPTEPAGG